MANTYKILGQVAPDAAAETTLYTVQTPATSAVCSSIVVCNRGTAARSFRVSISPAGDPTDNKDYLYYDVTLAGNDTFIATIGITLNLNDVIRVYSDTGSLSFNLFGTELS
jgi:hypothetical protein